MEAINISIKEKQKIIKDFMQAWNKHDLDKIMSFMHKDCVFFEARGTVAEGKTHRGYENVEKAFEKVLQNMPDAQWNQVKVNVLDDCGISEWMFSATIDNNKYLEVKGVDVFTFKEGKILVKDSFLKSRPTIEK